MNLPPRLIYKNFLCVVKYKKRDLCVKGILITGNLDHKMPSVHSVYYGLKSSIFVKVGIFFQEENR